MVQAIDSQWLRLDDPAVLWLCELQEFQKWPLARALPTYARIPLTAQHRGMVIRRHRGVFDCCVSQLVSGAEVDAAFDAAARQQLPAAWNLIQQIGVQICGCRSGLDAETHAQFRN
jgi:hypothetical protein